VPITSPAVVSRSLASASSTSARPKSITRGTGPPSAAEVTTMLSGLRSRCTNPRSWAWLRPSTSWTRIGSTSSGVMSCSRQQLPEAGAVGEIHRQVEQALGGLADVDHADHVGMIEAARGVGLVGEPGPRLAVVADLAERHLDREPPRHADVARAVHAADAAVADHVLDLIALGEHGADQQIVVARDQDRAVAGTATEVTAEHRLAGRAVRARWRRGLRTRA
jgi:hypothetical protein